MRWRERRDGHREILVALLDGEVAGTVSMGGRRHGRPGSLRLFALDVGPAYRRRGVGAALIGAVEQEARRRNLRAVNLEVAVENEDAIRLYERLGYERQGGPFIDRWWRLKDDGTRDQVEQPSYVLAKGL